jgi:hypothetical protein
MSLISRRIRRFAMHGWLLAWGCVLAMNAHSASDPDWVLIPDERRATVWQVFADGKVTRLDFSRLPMSPWPGSTPKLALHPSPRQDQVVYGFNNDLWLFDVGTAKHRRLTRAGQPYSAQYASVEVQFMAWALDGSQMLYQVVGGDTEAQGDGPTWTVKRRKADYGNKMLNLATGTHTATKLQDGWSWNSPSWDAKQTLYVVVPAASKKALDEELHAFHLASGTSTRLVDERAWWGIPQLSSNGLWLIAHAGKRATPSTEPLRNSDLRVKLVKVHLPTGQVTDATPLGRWAEFNAEALSPSGESLAYFRRTLKAPGDTSGTLVANGRVLLESTGRVDPYWIDETRLAFVQMREVNEGGPRIGVIDASSGKLLTSFDLPAAR